MEQSNNHSDTTLRCRICEGKLAKTEIELQGLPGETHRCTECGQYWFLQKLLTREVLQAMEVTE